MQPTLVAILVLHVLSVVFWAGSTFTLARIGGEHAIRLYRPQMGSAALGILTGIVLWGRLYRGPMGTPGILLGVGVFCSLLAAAIQIVVVGGARRNLAVAGGATSAAGERVTTAERAASGLLAIALILMAVVRYI